MKKNGFKRISMLLMLAFMLTNVFSLGMLKVKAEGTYASDLFISEYIEGGSNNKAIEIYNGTANTVDLSQYTIELYSNGGATAAYNLTLEGSLGSGEVYIVANSGAVDAIKNIAQITSTVTYFNGDDALVLKHGDSIIDSIGKVGEDPGTYWGSVDKNTLDHTLVRKSTITQGDSNASDAFDPTVEWDILPKDDFTNLGRHTMDGFGQQTDPKVAQVTATPTSGTEVPLDSKVTLTCDTEGATITYKLNDGEETVYTEPVTLDQSAFVNGTATIKAKAAKDGLITSEEVTFVYTIKNPLEIITAQEAKGKPAGAEVRVKGIVTYSTQGRTIFMQDSSGGICVDKSGTTLSGYVGKEIDVTGKIALYGGMVQVTPATLNDIKITNETPAMPLPLVVSINELNTSNRVHEGKLIKVENVQIKTLGGPGTSTYNHIVTQGGYEITLRAKELTGRKVGDFITITGVAGYFNSPQVQANVVDIVDGVAPAVENVTADPITGSTLPIGGTVTLSTSTADANIIYTLNGGAEQTIASNSGTVTINEFNQTDGKAVIKAKASKGSYVTPEAVFTYTQAKTQKVTASPVGAVSGNSQITLTAANNATIRFIVTKKAGLEGESSDPEAVYSAPIQITEAMLPAKITAYATLEGYLPSDPEIFNYYLASNKPYRNYFGQLHSHTAENSDGAGTLVEAYTYARDVANLDFFAVTDHSNSFDTSSPDDKAGTYNLGAYNKNNQKWINGQKAASDALREDFISVYAYEMTWSGGPGHMNTFATEGFVSRNNKELNNKSNDAGLKAYYQLLKDTPNSISQFNHPGETFGNFSDFSYLDPIIDARISLIEVGNGEGAVGSGAYFASYEEYIKALDKGWHLAPTNNQDNHKKKWGDANTARTVIYTNDYSVIGLYDALKDMRVYATEDNNLDIVYTLNGEMLGTIIENVPGQADFDVTVSDPDSVDRIQSISIISNGGKEVYSQTYGTQNATLDKTFSTPAAGYYYIKVVQADGQIAVTAPVWLGSAPRIGIDSVGYDTMMPVTNEPITFTTKLFNNESEAVKIKSISYKVKDGITIGTHDLNADIASSSMYSHAQSYTFTQPGIYTVAVTAVITQNGSDKAFTKDIEVNVRDSAKLMYVGIDASHDNEYVSGNYKASMGNFAKMAAKFNVRVVELKTSEELISAMQNPKYKMMVFTVPSRRNGTTGRIPFKSYSQSELDAVAAFAKSGKTVIVTGWGDYYENYSNLKSDTNFTADQHMAAQQNKVLAAIGASLRLSDDEVKDDSKNGGQPQRLYLTDFNNYQDPFTQGIVDGQVFSQYGGSSIYAVDSDGTSLSQLPSSIKPTISGHATTYSSDDDKDGNAIPPKYNDKVLLMANETVTHQDGTKSTVIAAGGAFMSNFEIQVEVENAGTLPYGNYNILQNIIASLSNISTIADVRNMPIGTDVVIEGIATTDVYNGSDSNKGFFDCIYVQDRTGGINLFPVSSGVQAGQRIRVTGTVGQYQGEKQIQNAKVTVINSNINLIAPKSVTPEEAMLASNTGTLVTFTGIVTEIKKDNDGVVSQLMVSGARVYINGYITKNVSLANIKIGDTVKVTGIASIGENMSSDTEFLPRIRVRDRGEIVVPVTGITLDVTEKTLIVKDTLTLNATVLPEDASNKNVEWTSSDTTVATVENGVVTAVKAGTAEITVTTADGAFTAKCTITVVKPVTGVTLDKESATINVGEKLTLIATVEPGDASNKNVEWTSSDTTVATVGNGVVTAVKAGTAEITVTTADGDFTAKCTITVLQPVTGITLDNNSLVIKTNNTAKLNAVVAPEDASDKSVTWTSDNESVATVSDDGTVTAVSAGMATITAETTDGHFKATCKVYVTLSGKVVLVTGVTLDKNIITLRTESKGKLKATVSPSNSTFKDVVWTSSNNEIVTVDEDGNLTANKVVGDAVITVTTKDGSFTAKCRVVVVDVIVKSVELDYEKLDLTTNEKDIFLKATAVLQTETDNDVFADEFIWTSSNASIADVLRNESGEPILTDGKVTIVAKAAGKASITATSVNGGKKASCLVTVAPITGVKLDKTLVNIKTGTKDVKTKKEEQVISLNAVVVPSYAAHAKDKGIFSWASSNETVAAVNGDSSKAQVTVNTSIDGKADITVTVTDANGQQFTEVCTIVVESNQIKSVKFDKSSASMTNTEGMNTLELKPVFTTTQKDQEPTFDELELNSDKPEIASVEFKEGKIIVTAHAAGKATITATTVYGNKTAKCTIYVAPVTGVKLNKTSATLLLNSKTKNSVKLTATVMPTNAAVKDIEFESANENIAKVDENGLVTAVGLGTTTITVTTKDGNKIATCTISVIETPVSKIEIRYADKKVTSLILKSADVNTRELQVVVLPENATIKDFIVISSDEEVLTVEAEKDENGNLTGKIIITVKGTGKAKITVKSVEGNKTAYCNITVK